MKKFLKSNLLAYIVAILLMAFVMGSIYFIYLTEISK